MKTFAFLLFACSLAFAQVDYTGYGSEEAAYAELDANTQGGDSQNQDGGSVWDNPANYDKSKSASQTTYAEPEQSVPKEETWEDSWQKRRFNVSFFMGFFPVTSLADIIVAAFDDEDNDPDLVAYSVGIGYELFYLLELGVMVDYTTVARTPVVAVIPRVKLNWLNFKYFRLYSYVGLGGMFWDDGGTIMFNFAVLGFEVGYKISFFAEGGWGQVGLFTIGAKLAF